MEPDIEDDHIFYEKNHFHHLLHVEKMRAERSQKPLLLMLLDVSSVMNNGASNNTAARIKEALCPALREVDIRGWYNYNQTIGVIFTEMSSIDSSAIEAIIQKIHRHFCEKIDRELINKINIFFHIYPKM
jgi:hypothetical protein